MHVGKSTIPKIKRVWWYPYDKATTATLGAAAEVLSAPTVAQKVTAAKKLVTNIATSIRNKI